MDGKPIYRKIVYINKSGTSLNGTSLASLGLINISFVTSVEGWGHDTDAYGSFKWTQNSCSTQRNFWFNQDYSIIHANTEGHYNIFDYLMFEYTKTTD